MKTQLQILVLWVLSLLLFGACTSDTVDPLNPGLPDDAAWHVSWFWDQDKDETSDFAGYDFYFKPNQVFETVRNGTATSGTWKVTSDDGSQRLVLFISANKPLSELNDDWIIVESTENTIKLKDDNDEHLEELTFSKVGSPMYYRLMTVRFCVSLPDSTLIT